MVLSVMIRKDKKDGQLYAVLPYAICDPDNNSTYLDVHGHSACNLQVVMERSVNASYQEARQFIRWMEETYGYSVRLIRKINESYRLRLIKQNRM